MKKIIILLIGFMLVTSCDNQLDINKDPDSIAPEDLALNVELPGAITGVAGSQGAGYALIGGFWSQFWTQSNAANQYRVIDNYNLGTTDNINSGAWLDMYDGLLDVRNVKKNAQDAENWNYYLIATVVEVYASQLLTDFYGDIPYSEANNSLILQPAFDTGEAVYDQMIADLNDALSRNLGASQGITPGADDVIFEGDMSAWIKFANTLKLRIYMRQTEARSGVAQNGISSMLNAQFLDEDASITGFTDAPNLSNPLYESDRRQLNTQTNLRASTTMYSYLEANNDPRLALFYGAGNPLDQGDFNNTEVAPASIAVVTLSPTTDVHFISREESLFLQAEAMLRYNGGTGVKALYDAAVIENFSKWGIDGSSFVAAGGAYEFPTSGSFEEQLEAIIVQKWVSSFPGNGFESYFEWLRTGYPETSDVAQSDNGYVPGEFSYSINGTTGGVFPQRIEYPNTELQRNDNAPTLELITSPIWWKQ